MPENSTERSHSAKRSDTSYAAKAPPPQQEQSNAERKGSRQFNRSNIIFISTVIGTVCAVVGVFVGLTGWHVSVPFGTASPSNSPLSLHRPPPTSTLHSTNPNRATREGSLALQQQTTLFDVIPDSIEATCHRYSHDSVLRGALVLMQCRSKGIVVRFGLFKNESSIYRAYWNRVTYANLTKDSGSQYCQDGMPAEQSWNYQGDSADGRYFCYKARNGHAWIEWTYDTQWIYAYAYRTDGDIKRLYQWWFNFS